MEYGIFEIEPGTNNINLIMDNISSTTMAKSIIIDRLPPSKYVILEIFSTTKTLKK